MNPFHMNIQSLARILMVTWFCFGCAGHSEVDQLPRMESTIVARGAHLHGANGIIFDTKDRLHIASVFGREIVVMDPASGQIIERFGAEKGVRCPDDLQNGT